MGVRSVDGGETCLVFMRSLFWDLESCGVDWLCESDCLCNTFL